MSRGALASTDAEIEALDAVCQRLASFGCETSAEWVDGCFTAMICGPRRPTQDEWLPLLFGGDFERVFADPVDATRALAPLQSRWNVLVRQLDAEALLDAPDQLRLQPVMIQFDDESRAKAVATGTISEADASRLLQTGGEWSEAFLSTVQALAEDWTLPPAIDPAMAELHANCLDCIGALQLAPDELAPWLAEHFAGETLDRDALVDEALFAAQDLRIFWLDHAPRPETRRTGPQPGRNDPCPCGSGKKFKKCHGA